MYVPSFAVSVALRTLGEEPEGGLAVVGESSSGAVLVAASRGARLDGVKVGMSCSAALAVAPEVLLLEQDSLDLGAVDLELERAVRGVSPALQSGRNGLLYVNFSGMERRYAGMGEVGFLPPKDPRFIATVERLAEDLPPQMQIFYSGQAESFQETSGGIVTTFALALLVVFLVLAAQFESFVQPVVILLSVPLAVAGALLTLFVLGEAVNIYTQVGMVMLIGLMAKNGILIVEFANQLRDQGQPLREAVIEAATVRLRPILMTVLSTVLGAVPLVLSSGAGAESRFSIGLVIIGGFMAASVLTLFLTPVLYDLLQRDREPERSKDRVDGAAPTPAE